MSSIRKYNSGKKMLRRQAQEKTSTTSSKDQRGGDQLFSLASTTSEFDTFRIFQSFGS